jgi:hypothetical protein
MMAGLARICKLYGSIVINGQKWVWDYAQDKAVPQAEMTKERLTASEKAKWETVSKRTAP